jgi:hypothetical protein
MKCKGSYSNPIPIGRGLVMQNDSIKVLGVEAHQHLSGDLVNSWGGLETVFIMKA